MLIGEQPGDKEDLAEDRLGGASPQVAAAALGGGLAQRRERAALGEERPGVVGLGGGRDP
ncbi:MAG: hypothetical protein QOD13_3086, partial [Thermoleophilaceae bacterium]|nr:hypothetical protein [Thermoleophilaceae bacterium]